MPQAARPNATVPGNGPPAAAANPFADGAPAPVFDPNAGGEGNIPPPASPVAGAQPPPAAAPPPPAVANPPPPPPPPANDDNGGGGGGGLSLEEEETIEMFNEAEDTG